MGQSSYTAVLLDSLVTQLFCGAVLLHRCFVGQSCYTDVLWGSLVTQLFCGAVLLHSCFFCHRAETAAGCGMDMVLVVAPG